MAGQVYMVPVLIMTSDGPTIVSSTAEALIVTDFPISPGTLYQGKTYMGVIHGRISNVVTSTPTITLRVRLGTVSLTGTVAATTGALTTRATAATTETWFGQFYVTCRSNGSGGTAMTTGIFTLPNLTGATIADTASVALPSSAPATSAVDTTVSNILGVTAQWSASNAANGITVHNYVLYELN